MLKVGLFLLLCNLEGVIQFKVKFNAQMEHIYENVQPKVICLAFRRMQGSQAFRKGYNFKFCGKKTFDTDGLLMTCVSEGNPCQNLHQHHVSRYNPICYHNLKMLG